MVAVLPLYVQSVGPLRIVRFIGHGASDELGPVCERTDRPQAARALRQLLEKASFAWDVFIGDELPGEFPWAEALGARELRRTPSPVVDLRGGSSPTRHELAPDEAQRKLSALSTYRTQFPALNGGPLGLLSHPLVCGYEVSWTVGAVATSEAGARAQPARR